MRGWQTEDASPPQVSEPGPEQCMRKWRAAHDMATSEVAKVVTTWKYGRVIEVLAQKCVSKLLQPVNGSIVAGF
jgi:hypothetical protein